MAMNKFKYLISDYGFAVKKVDESKRNPQTEGRIEFETSMTFVTVSCEQWAVNVSFGRVKDDKYRFFLYPEIIHEYFALIESDKKLVCSIDPKDDKKAKMIIHQIQLQHNQNNSNSSVERIESQLTNYSKWLRQYAEPFLQGDFSQWLKIYEYKVSRSRTARIRSGKDEFSLHFVRLDENGKPVHEKRSVFQASFDYLERLREEYLK